MLNACQLVTDKFSTHAYRSILNLNQETEEAAGHIADDSKLHRPQLSIEKVSKAFYNVMSARLH